MFTAEAINHHLDGLLEYRLPKSGLAFWLQLNRKIDTDSFFANCAAANLKLVSGREYAVAEQWPRAFRFGFAHMNLDEIKKCITLLEGIAKASLATRFSFQDV